MTKDIHNGDFIQVWEDDGDTYVNFKSNGCALMFSPEQWEAIKNEFKQLIIDGIRNNIQNNRKSDE